MAIRSPGDEGEQDRAEINFASIPGHLPRCCTGGDGAEADGEMSEFDFKHGPGTRLTEGEMEDIRSEVRLKISRRAYLRKADFEKHGYTDRCGGCSATLRGGEPPAARRAL